METTIKNLGFKVGYPLKQIEYGGCRGNIGIVEKKMETTIMGYIVFRPLK